MSARQELGRRAGTGKKLGIGNKKEAGTSAAETDNVRSLPKRELPLGIVLDACPNMRDLADGAQIRHWRDFLAAAEVARPMLGVSPSAWKDALEVMGEQQAAITLAAIYQKGEQINNAGGYLRSLRERAREGKFSTWPMIMALLRTKLDSSKADGEEDGRESGATKLPSGTAEQDRGGLQVSEALRRSLEKPKRR